MPKFWGRRALLQKFLFTLTLGLLAPVAAISSPSDGIADLQSAVNVSILEIQNLEDFIHTQEITLTSLKSQEMGIREKVKQQESHIISLVNYLNHAKDFSPFLSVLATQNVNDIIHLSILLKYIGAVLPEKFKGSFDILKELANARHELSQAENQLSTLEDKKKKEFTKLKKNFAELEELLELNDQPLPIRHFDSASQINEVVIKLTNATPGCQKVNSLTGAKIENPVFMVPTTEGEAFSYKGIKDSIVRSPLDADVILSGYSAETKGVILIRKSEYIMLVEGIDKILSFVGIRVKEQQPLGLVFSDMDHVDQNLKVTLWQCKQRM